MLPFLVFVECWISKIIPTFVTGIVITLVNIMALSVTTLCFYIPQQFFVFSFLLLLLDCLLDAKVVSNNLFESLMFAVLKGFKASCLFVVVEHFLKPQLSCVRYKILCYDSSFARV